MYVIMKSEERGKLRVLCEKDFKYWSGVLCFAESIDSPVLFQYTPLAYLHKLGFRSCSVIEVDIQDCEQPEVMFRKGWDYEWLRRKGTDKVVKIWSMVAHRRYPYRSVYDHSTGEVMIKDVGVFPWSDFERIDLCGV